MTSVSVGLAVVAPLAAAVVALVFAGAAGERVAPIGLLIAAAGGAVAAAALSAIGEAQAWRGFDADPWRAALAAGACLAAAAAIKGRRPEERALHASLAGLAAASLFAPNALWLGLALPATTGVYGAVLLAQARRAEDRVRALRALSAMLVADVVALVGLASAGRRGYSLPVGVDGGAWLVAIAAAIRLGLWPALLEEAFLAGGAAPALGPIRAQGALLAALVAASGGAPSRTLAGVGAAAALAGGWRVVRDGSAPALAAVQAGIVAIGFGVGGPAGVWGAVLLVGASLAAWPPWLAGRGVQAARASLGLAPAGAGLAGAALVCSAALQAAASHPAYLLLATPAIAAVAASAIGVWRTERPEQPEEETQGDVPVSGVSRGGTALDGLWLAPALGAVALLVVVPARVTSAFATRVAATLGLGRLLGGNDLGVGEDLGLWMAIAAVIGLAAAAGGGEPAPREARPGAPRWAAWWSAAAPVPGAEAALASSVGRWRRLAGALGIATLALAVRLYVLAAGNGFL